MVSIKKEPMDSDREEQVEEHMIVNHIETMESTPLKKEKKKKKKASNADSNMDIKSSSDQVIYKNQPVVIGIDGSCSKNRTIVGGFSGHRYDIGKVVSFQKSNVNGHPTIYTNRPIQVLGSIGVMIVNERSSRRVGQDRMPVYGVEIGTNKYSWVSESVIEEVDGKERNDLQPSSMDLTPTRIIGSELLSPLVHSDNSTSDSSTDPTLKKRKRDQTASSIQAPKLDLTFLQPFPNFPPFGLTHPKVGLPQIEFKMKLLHMSPQKAHSKSPTHFVIYLSLNEEDSLLKSNLITHLFSPFSSPICICFIDKSNPTNVYTITKKHILTPLQDNLRHDLEIFSYTPTIKENNLECTVKVMYGPTEILTYDNGGLDFVFYGDQNSGEIEQNPNIHLCHPIYIQKYNVQKSHI